MGLDNSKHALDEAAAHIRPLFTEDNISIENNLNLRARREASWKL
jgi:hypothetical protein